MCAYARFYFKKLLYIKKAHKTIIILMKNDRKIKKLLPDEQKRKKRKKIVLTIVIVLTLTPILAVAISAAGFAIWADGVSLDRTLLPTATAKPVFYDINNEKIDYLTDDYLTKDEIPQNLKNAFVALEDKRFYSHKGYDPIRIGGAMLSNIKSHSVKEGASTITQQLVKNTHLSNERTFRRKLNEIAIARKVEKEYSKDEILAMYLSVIYFGNGAYGVKQASQLYFDKEIDELSLQECATLAGIVKNPSKYSPFAKEEDCVARRNLTLEIMRKEGYIDEKECAEASATPITKSQKDKKAKNGSGFCDAYVKKVIDEVCDALGITKYQLNNSGYKIYTNLDVELQKSLYNNALNSSLRENDDVESVQIVADNKNNAIVAYYSTLPYDVKRQAGSIMKPVAVYAPAIDMNIVSLSTPVIDEKIDYSGYSPSNFNDVYLGETTVRQAIQKSLNSVAVKTLSYVGINNSAKYISNFGLKLEYSDQNFAIALGATSKGVSPLSMTDAYCTFANEGVFCKNSFIKRITDNGTKIYEPDKQKTTVLKVSTANIVTDALIDTVKDGTARTLSALPFEVAAKTGTAQRSDGKNSDAWCMSYNETYTVCVWHGNDVGINERGGGYPAQNNKEIWKAISKQSKQPQMFAHNKEIEYKDIDTYALQSKKQVLLATENTPIEYRKREVFPVGSLIEQSDCFDVVSDFDFQVVANANRVVLTFDTKKIYTYRIYRTDIFGQTLLCELSNDESVQKEIYDTPLAFYNLVEYRIECFVTANPQASSTIAKQVYVDDNL